MIEISHTQAQRLIRQRIDGPIPDEQWSVLQAHLEGCEECRAYQTAMQSSERSMRRVLRLRWSPVHGPRQTLESSVKSRRAARVQTKKLTSYLAIAGVIFLLGSLYAGYRRATAPPPTPTPNLAAIRQTPSPTPGRSTFRGVAAYVSEEEGNPEIFLLNPGDRGEDNELVNMTNDPGADTFPAWSPDGEWLAFLSDRGSEDGGGTGKDEVFVVHVAGSRLTRLTNDPGVAWHGPLTWSPDGQWIALTGTPIHADGSQTEDAWVYLVPVGGPERDAGPRKLGLTRGVTGQVRFSPADPILAYLSGGDPFTTLTAYDISVGGDIPVTAEDNASGMRTGFESAFGWSDDGRLAYLAEGQVDPVTGEFTSNAGVLVRTTLSPAQFGGGTYDSSSNQTIESLSGPGTIRQAVYVPGRNGREQIVVYLTDENSDGCWTLNLHLALERDSQPREIPGLCVDGVISRQSFTPDAQWLVTLGHLPDEKPAVDGAVTGLFALRIPSDLTTAEEDVIERVNDLTFRAGDDLPSPPAIRPSGELLGISPRAAADAAAVLPPAVVPSGLRGQVVYTPIQGYVGQPITAMQPDGSAARTLPADAQPGEDFYTCPDISPNGQQIAFLSDRETGQAWLNEVFVMDEDGENVRRVARNIFTRTPGQTLSFDCPTWSPDGTRLVSILRRESESQLAVIPLAEDAAVIYLPVPGSSVFTAPVWSPDGTQVLLAHHRSGQTPPRIAAVDLGEDGGDSPTLRTLVESDGWGDVVGMAYSPNGAQIAYVVAYYRAGLPTQFQLRLMDANGENLRNLGSLPESSIRGMARGIALEWDSDNRLVFMSRGAMHDRIKSHLWLLDLSQIDAVGITSIAALDDVVYDFTWSPDRRWLMLATEAGLLAVNVEEALAGESAPARITSERVYEVDWR